MAQQISMIKDITPDTPDWTAQVMVIEKGFPRLTKTQRLFQKIVMIDTEGTKVQGTIFGKDISVLKDTLKIYQTYSASNAVVQPTPPEHRVINNDHQWLLYARTPIEENHVPELSIRALQYGFVPLTELQKYANQPDAIDVLFAVLRVGPAKKTKQTWVQDIVIIDQGMEPTLLTLWDQFVDHEGQTFNELMGPYPIVLGMRMKFSSNNGIKLQTRGSTTFVFNPPLPDANTLQLWCMKNSAGIQKLPNIEMNQTAMIRSCPPQKKQIININRLPTTVQMDELYWIQASCRVTDIYQRFYYMSCSKCVHSTAARTDALFWCNYCKERVKPIPRCRFNVQLSDSSGAIVATLFGGHAETMFGITREYLKDNTEGGRLSHDAATILGTATEFAVQLRAYKPGLADSLHCLFTIVGIKNVSEIIEAEQEIPLGAVTKIPATTDNSNQNKAESSSPKQDQSTTAMEQDETEHSENKMKDRPHPTTADKNRKKKKD
ncbi:hypothetical protein Vadar_021917 [Vaccinium darrowii]|uniref:Uncharacterized protein n=1 Tax=Vaccinium darrowii TaxID=229202 RepID=A0ACB7XJV2_9ERIC|nr:hypothetical protein Vadar_021917 [Vaccinium darrowii]